MISVKTGLGGTVAAAALVACFALPSSASAQGLESYLANNGNFNVGSEGHTIVSLKSPKHFRVCNTFHRGKLRGDTGIATMVVDADGTQTTVRNGSCTDVEGAVIKVSSEQPNEFIVGSYSLID